MKRIGRIGLAGLILMMGLCGCTPETAPVQAPPGSSSPAAESTGDTPGTAPSGTQTTPTTVPPYTKRDEASSSSSSAPNPSTEIDRICQKYEASGLSLVAFRGEEVLYTYAGGYADQKKTKPVTLQTKYRIASISKTVTGLMALQLADTGRLDLDADISSYIGISMRSPQAPDVPITTRMLLSHTSGLMDSKRYNQNTDQPPFEDLTAIVEDGACFSSSRPGTRYRYSNFGCGLVAGVIEGVTGERFYTYTRSKFEEWGMDAAYLRTQIDTPDTIAQIFRGRSLRADVPHWGRVEEAYEALPLGHLYLLAHGDLIISAPDLAKIGMVLAGDGSYAGKTWLSADRLREMRTPIKNGYGLTLTRTTQLVKGRTMYGHAGKAYGMVAGLYVDPDDRTGVALITNGCSTAKNTAGLYEITDALVNELYRTVFVEAA